MSLSKHDSCEIEWGEFRWGIQKEIEKKTVLISANHLKRSAYPTGMINSNPKCRSKEETKFWLRINSI